MLYRRSSEKRFRTLLEGFDADYAPVTVKDDVLYYVTNRDAMNYALCRVDLNSPKQIETVIPEHETTLLEGVSSVGGYLFASYLENAQDKIVQFDFDGRRVRDVQLRPSVPSAASTVTTRRPSSTTRSRTIPLPRPSTITTSPRRSRPSTRLRR